MPNRAGHSHSVSIAFVGKGGAGVVTAGEILLIAAARAGWYGLMIPAVGPQIRGGESAALLRLGDAPVHCLDDRIDVLAGINWHHVESFRADIPLDASSLVVTDPSGEPLPDFITAAEPRTCELAMTAIAESVAGGRENMVLLGYVARLAGIPESALREAIEKKLSRKGPEAVAASTQCMELGYAEAAVVVDGKPGSAAARSDRRWLMSGNHATGLGALRGGIRFAAAYPITPATEVLEWLAPRIARAGGTLVQAEDELASINMVIGASFAGVPSLTATAGPGLSLMIEGLGLAVGAEVPVVVVDVMRGGPSTGIPTKPEQSDLNIAVYGLHGDAPHIVVAPNSVSDCVFTTQWAVHLAEAIQVPVIVLSDQFIGQSSAVLDPVPEIAFFAKRRIAEQADEDFERYAITADGISPVPVPGTPGGQYTAGGLTHSPKGRPSGRADDHFLQLEKRARKIAEFDYGRHWADVDGDGDLAVITWGSTTGTVNEAVGRLATEHRDRLRVISLRLLLPAQPGQMASALDGVERAIVVEQNYGSQLYRFLRAWYDLPAATTTLNRPGPSVFRPGEVADRLGEWIGK